MGQRLFPFCTLRSDLTTLIAYTGSISILVNFSDSWCQKTAVLNIELGVEELDQVCDPEGAFHDPRGTCRIPLHHADVVRGDKARRIPLGLIQEFGLLGQDRLGIIRFAEVIDPPDPQHSLASGASSQWSPVASRHFDGTRSIRCPCTR